MPVSFLRKFFGEVILVISGQSRRMYQSLEPKIGGNNLFQEVNASGDSQSSSRRFHQY
jgi:hypothetical protein